MHVARKLREEQLDVRESVRAHPELKSTFLSIRAAEVFAYERITDPRERERFLEFVRGAMAGSIHKGAPLSSVTLRHSRMRSETTSAPGRRQSARSQRDERSRERVVNRIPESTLTDNASTLWIRGLPQVPDSNIATDIPVNSLRLRRIDNRISNQRFR